ncbi:MAG: acyltransferase family protein, partial [Acidimicrobiaceae bacterium]|nr:acyltransferase family protein [Acidimicrobiaceae bacterium]
MTRAGASTGAPRHLHALDVVRLVTFVTVIAVHSTSVLLPDTTVGAGAGVLLLHTSREIFVLLSAFVLCYSSRGRVTDRRRFWRRRFPLVLAPYVVWW